MRAVEMELRAREQAVSRPLNRSLQLILPKLEIEKATFYYDMVEIHKDQSGYGFDWYSPSTKHNQKVQTQKVRVTPVPLLAKYDDNKLYDFIVQPLATDYRSHNQACERGVQQTSKACKKRVLYERRLGSALLTVDSLQIYPEMNRKRLFQEAFE